MYRFVFVSVCILVLASGCTVTDPFADVDPQIKIDLSEFLHTVAFGWEGSLSVADSPGLHYVGEVTGSVSGASEVRAYSYIDSEPTEIDSVEPGPGGNWELTVLYGPKIVLAWQDEEMVGQWLEPRTFVNYPWLESEPGADYYLVDPLDTALVALALYMNDQLQDAADVLAPLQAVHQEFSGLPESVDVFGRADADAAISIEATAWAGYVAALLAKASDQAVLWAEAEAYAGYLEQLQYVPNDPRQQLPGMLLFEILTSHNNEYQALATAWEVQAGDQYDPYAGLAMALSGERVSQFVDTDFAPQTEAEKWLHFNVLAAAGETPPDLEAELDALTGQPVGSALMADNEPCIAASAWMSIALSGNFR
ncbi:MAG: hypothetical protein FH749_08720 [Firmicutes bacterium]|nr:hypothetical protein [Bacillota bacterium]